MNKNTLYGNPQRTNKTFEKVNVSQCDAVRSYSISRTQLKTRSSLSTGKHLGPSDVDCLQVAVMNSRSNCLIRSNCHILKILYLEPITLDSTNETLLHLKRKRQNNTM